MEAEGQQFSAHKAVLCSCSPYFDRMFQPGFVEQVGCFFRWLVPNRYLKPTMQGYNFWTKIVKSWDSDSVGMTTVYTQTLFKNFVTFIIILQSNLDRMVRSDPPNFKN